MKNCTIVLGGERRNIVFECVLRQLPKLARRMLLKGGIISDFGFRTDRGTNHNK